VISLGAERKELATTGATKSVADDILPRPLWNDCGERLTENWRTRRNLDEGTIGDMIACNSNGLREVSG
jgi:hypothetical protein